jgi:uncharacterized protein YbcI
VNVLITKGQLEAEIGSAIMKFEKEYFGRGPRELQTYILKNMIIIMQKGVLTLAEEQLADNSEGVELIRRLREKLLKTNKKVLAAIFHSITECQVISVYTDISVEQSEKMIMVTLDKDLERLITNGKAKAV